MLRVLQLGSNPLNDRRTMDKSDAERLAAFIVKTMTTHSDTSWVDDDDLRDCCIDGWFNMVAVAEDVLKAWPPDRLKR